MEEIAGWVAPIATTVAAMMTAANLGSRITGYGFVVFTVGSIAWSMVGIATGQQNLLLTNGFLTLVNLVGIWRWLGREARYEDGSQRATERSQHRHAPTLYGAKALVGSKVVDRDGEALGSVVDAMLSCEGNSIAYLVVTDGAGAGLAETLRALGPDEIAIHTDRVQTRLDASAFAALPGLETTDWPATLAEARAARSAPAAGSLAAAGA